MELIPQSQVIGKTGSVLALAMMMLTGCMGGTSSEFFSGKPQAPPAEGICEVATIWKNEVVYTPDPTRGGRNIPGIAGRLYFYGEKRDFSRMADGAVVVDLYDMTHPDPQVNMPPLEEWRIDKVTLQKLFRQDTIGWGYTVFLPWSTYRPDLTHIELRVRFESGKGLPIYAQSEPMTLNSDMDLTIKEVTRQLTGQKSPSQQQQPINQNNGLQSLNGNTQPGNQQSFNNNQGCPIQQSRLGINPLEGFQPQRPSIQPNANQGNGMMQDWNPGNR
jgi:hypothetical protein